MIYVREDNVAMDIERLYNENYYKTSFGGDSYLEESKWMPFYESIADNIVNKLHPSLVLDVGCATGYLVAALRDRGVEAYGIDVSEFAIGRVREDIRPFCKVCNVLDSLPSDLPQRYDLLVTIEVAEHLYEEDGNKFIESICKYSDQVIFSSTPDDKTEKTHFNVQLPDYWAKRFAGHGFYHDLFEDVSYITPHAMFFKKMDLSNMRIVELYERKMRIDYITFNKSMISIEDMNKKLAEGNQYLQLQNSANLKVIESLSENKILLQEKLENSARNVLELQKKLENSAINVLELQNKLEEALMENRSLNESVKNITEVKLELQKKLEESSMKSQLLLESTEKLSEEKKQLLDRIDELTEECKVFCQDIIDNRNLNTEIVSELKIDNLKLLEECNKLKFELEKIKNSRGFRFLCKLYRIEDILIPRSSKRFKVAKFVYYLPKYIRFGYVNKAFRYIKANGFKGLFRKTMGVVKNNHLINNMIKNADSYKIWIELNEPDAEELKQQRVRFSGENIKISIVVPLYNTPVVFLKELIDSIINQSYENWELCLADGNSKNGQELKEVIDSYKNEKIKYIRLSENKGISGNTNAAIEMSTGDFIAFVDHDDVLPPFALYEVINCIKNCEGVDFIYSDDDRINKDGSERCYPCFKPDFSIDRLRCCNYIGHLTVAKRSLIYEVGLLNSEYDGSQDHDFVLRSTEKAKRIEHIPKVLYHWRMHENSVALNENSKEYATVAAKKALSAHLKRIGLKGEVINGVIPNSYKIEYEITDNRKISIIIPTMDHVQELKTCVDSILSKSTYQNYEIILVENNSKLEETFEYYKSIETNDRVKVVFWPSKGFNYAAIVNYGVRYANGEYIVILNNDTEVITPRWLEEMLMFAQQEEVGMVGPKMYYPDDSIWNTGIALSLNASVTLLHNKIPRESSGYYGQASIVQNFSALAGACIMIRKDLFLEVGGFDEVNFAVAHNDMDLSLKLVTMGKRLVFTPYAELYHHESKSRGSDFVGDNLKRFIAEDTRFLHKWKEYLRYGDPFFNINFKDGNPYFQIKTEEIQYKYL